MSRHRYTVILEKEEEGGFHAFVPALRGCHTQGDTEESLQAHGEPIPEEDLLIRPVEVGA
jgi:predicted RNase H-like HicB family nuclease